MRSKKIGSPCGWNTWDFRSFNNIVFLNQGLFEFKLKIMVYDSVADKLQTNFRWPDMPQRGPHAIDGCYWDYTFKALDSLYKVEVSSCGFDISLKITPLNVKDRKRVVIALMPAGEERIIQDGDRLRTQAWNIAHPGLNNPWDAMFFIPMETPYLFNNPGQPMGLALSKNEIKLSLQQIDDKITKAREAYTLKELCGTGQLASSLMAIPRSVSWNTIYDSRWTGVETQISRDWSADWLGTYIFPWDQFFMGYLSNTIDSKIALENFKAILATATPEGFLPNYNTAFGAQAFDRSQPPVGAYLVWKTYALTGDKELLSECYAGLKKWHAWWMKDRDPKNTGLLSWGSNKKPEFEFPHLKVYNPSQQNEHICALYEAGMDNFPIMQKLDFDKEAQTLAGHCVALNSLYILDCEGLANIASELKLAEEAQQFRQEAQDMQEKMRQRLYDPETGVYCLRAWDGSWLHDISIITFYPMCAGVATKKQADFMVKQIMLDPKKFWGEYVMSVTALDYPASGENDYWAGRIWPPTNFFVYEGLKRYGYDKIAAEFAEKAYNMFEKGWTKANLFCENYNMKTGAGDDVWNSSTGYGWGALLANNALQELIDIEGWHNALRLGTLSEKDWGVKNYNLAQHAIDIISSFSGLTINLDHKCWIKSSKPIVLRFKNLGQLPIDIDLNYENAGKLLISNNQPGATIKINDKGQKVELTADAEGDIRFEYGC